MKFFFFALLFIICTVPANSQSMTDAQIMEYVKISMNAGKSEEEIALELSRKGVSREQGNRVKEIYKKNNPTKLPDNDSEIQTSIRKGKVHVESDDMNKKNSEFRDTILSKREKIVFGRDIFNTSSLSFEPSLNLATPPNYRLGPSDEVIIDIWGTSQQSIRQVISPEGCINIDKIGPVNLNGMTITEANSYVKKILSKIYHGLAGDNGDIYVRLTLGNSRTIQINVMGEVVQPGTYSLSSFATIFHALYRAGGVNEIGSLRKVQLVRLGKIIKEIDIYDFILKGTISGDISLQEGDVVLVPAYDIMVEAKGKFKRDFNFELKEGETLATLIKYCGGFESDAYTKSLRIIRKNGEFYEVNSVKQVDYSVFKMMNGDIVTADSILNRFINKLEIKGAVYRPGIYELNASVNTVKSLILEAQGLMGDAFTNRGVLQRERKDFTTEIIPVDVKNILAGNIPDIILHNNDVLYIPSIHDLSDRGDVKILGEVTRPGEYGFSDNMTLEDLIIRAGGLNEAASTVRVDIARRIKNPDSVEYSDSIGQLFTFALKDGFVIEGKQGFILQPYDQITVRRSPKYHVQQNIYINGEVMFPGNYSMTQREERLTNLLQKAGGLTPKAYLKGARLIRVANEVEKQRMRDMIKLMEKQFGNFISDSLKLKIEDTYPVGINLENAVANPGSFDDLVLREGDVLDIPVLNNTVKINGAVMMPNTVTYVKGKNVRYYLEQAGGYSSNAKKSKKFVIYMNGQVSKVRSGDEDKIQPGCEIFVPLKTSKRTSVGEILGHVSSFASLATMFATLTNLIKN